MVFVMQMMKLLRKTAVNDLVLTRPRAHTRPSSCTKYPRIFEKRIAHGPKSLKIDTFSLKYDLCLMIYKNYELV